MFDAMLRIHISSFIIIDFALSKKSCFYSNFGICHIEPLKKSEISLYKSFEILKHKRIMQILGFSVNDCYTPRIISCWLILLRLSFLIPCHTKYKSANAQKMPIKTKMDKNFKMPRPISPL